MPNFNLEYGEQNLDILLQNLFDIIPDACVVFNNYHYIVKMNSKAEEYFLFPKEYMMSKPFWEIAPQYVDTEFFHAINHMKKEKKEIYIEFGGSTTNRWFGVSIRNIGDYIIAFFKDITSYKHIQNELLRAEDRFTAVYRKGPALMSIISLENNRFISVNDNFADFFGYEPNEIIGKTKEDVFIIDVSQSIDAEVQQSNSKFNRPILCLQTKTNGYKYLIISSEQITINGIPCQLEVGIDITDKIKYQKELTKLESLNILGQLSASIAHEIRNPLQIIKGFLQLLESKEEILGYRDYLELILDEINRANEIISEFLALSRTKPTNLKLQSINKIVNKVLPLIEAQAIKEDKKINVELGCVDDILLDENEIKQVILNLTKNGLEAIQAKESIKLVSIQDESSVKLIVSDQGKGISPQLQDKIGTPFFTTKYDGTGLGLAMSISILERHNAKLNFVSDNINGTTFCITFPLMRPNSWN